VARDAYQLFFDQFIRKVSRVRAIDFHASANTALTSYFCRDPKDLLFVWFISQSAVGIDHYLAPNLLASYQ
jgi:hypothetical protein